MLRSDAPTSGRISDWIEHLDRVDSLACVRRHAERTLDALAAHGGRRFLDIGCGIGHDVRRLARRVGPSGQVVGVDTSERLVAEARRRTTLRNCRFEIADGRRLPFPDAAFHAARIARVLHWYADPRPFVDEMVRVVHPGGAVMLTEPDFRSLAIGGVDPRLTAPVLRMYEAQPAMDARSLASLLTDAGVASVECLSDECTVSDAVDAAALYDLAIVARAGWSAGHLDPMGAFVLIVAARRAQRAGTYAVTLTGHTAVGVLPAGA